MHGLQGSVVVQNVTAVGNVAGAGVGTAEVRTSGGDGSLPARKGAGGFLQFAEPVSGSALLVLRGLSAWDNAAASGGVAWVGKGSVLLVSGMLAHTNEADVGGVLFCDQCELLGS